VKLEQDVPSPLGKLAPAPPVGIVLQELTELEAHLRARGVASDADAKQTTKPAALVNQKGEHTADAETITMPGNLSADVRIVAARGLKNRDSNAMGKSDPYCELLVNGVSKGQTEVRWNSLYPQWGKGSFEVRGLRWFDVLELKVWDHDRVLPMMSQEQHRESLGSCKMPVPAVGTKKDEWLQVVGTAEEVGGGEPPQLHVIVQIHEVMQRQRTRASRH